MKKILLLFGSRQLPIAIPSNEETIPDEEKIMVEVIKLKEKLNISADDQIILQRYDEDFDSWVEMVKSDVINHGEKLQLITIRHSASNPVEIAENGSEGTTSSDFDVSQRTGTDEFTPMPTSSNLGNGSGGIESEETCSNEDSCEGATPSSHSLYSVNIVTEILTSHQTLDNKQFNQVVRHFATKLRAKFGAHPTKTQYTSFCDTVVTAHPQLDSNLFKRALTKRFRNWRYLEKRDLQKLRGHREVGSVSIIDDDHELSVDEQMTQLSSEDPGPTTCNILTVTFARRRELIRGFETSREVVRNFPLFTMPEWISVELNLLIDELPRSSKVSERYVDLLHRIKAVGSLSDASDIDVWLYAERQIIPKRSQTSHPWIISTQVVNAGDSVSAGTELQSPSLKVVVSHDVPVTWAIVGEGMVLCKQNGENFDSAQAIISILATYYAYNYKYPPAYINFLSFLEMFLLNKDVDKKKLTVCCARFILKIKNVLND